MSNYENFYTRPIFQNRQMVQRSGHTITLSGETIINTIGTLQISAQILDFTGSTSASTIYNIAGVSGYINHGQLSSFIVRPPIILSAGTSATTTVDVTGYILGSLDSQGRVAWFPASNFFTGGTSGGTTYIITNFTGNTSASCITDLYISNLYGCYSVTIHDNVILVSGKTISSSIGGGQIDLTFSGISSNVVITSDSGVGLESMLEVSPTYSLLSNAGNSGGTQAHMMGVEFFNDPGVNNVTNVWSTGVYSMVNIGVSSEYSPYYNRYQDIVVQENSIYNAFTTSLNRNAVLIGSNGGMTNAGVKNSVVIGGSGLTATVNNTVYVPYLNIGGGYELTGNTSDRVLVRSSDGSVKTISQSSLVSTGTTATQFTGNTSADCISHLWITNLHGCSPITVWDNFRSVNSVIDTSTYLNIFGNNNTGTTSSDSFIAGGNINNMTGGLYSFMAGGWRNVMLSGIRGSSILGGILNKVDRGQQSSILGGSGNNILQTTANPEISSILLGGDSNSLFSNNRSSILGGRNSVIITSEASSIISSYRGKIDTASNSVIIGGVDNLLISGSSVITNSVIVGGQNITGTTNDTVYVPNLEVRGNLDMCVGGGTAFLPVISGCSPVTLQGHLVVNNTNTFGPIRPNYISELIISGMTNNSTYSIPISAGWVVEDIIIYTKIQDSVIDRVAIQTLGGIWLSGATDQVNYPLYAVNASLRQTYTNMKSVLGQGQNGYFNNKYYFNNSDTLIIYFKDVFNSLTDITDGQFKVLIKYWDGSEL